MVPSSIIFWGIGPMSPSKYAPDTPATSHGYLLRGSPPSEEIKEERGVINMMPPIPPAVPAVAVGEVQAQASSVEVKAKSTLSVKVEPESPVSVIDLNKSASSSSDQSYNPSSTGSIRHARPKVSAKKARSRCGRPQSRVKTRVVADSIHKVTPPLGRWVMQPQWMYAHATRIIRSNRGAVIKYSPLEDTATSADLDCLLREYFIIVAEAGASSLVTEKQWSHLVGVVLAKCNTTSRKVPLVLTVSLAKSLINHLATRALTELFELSPEALAPSSA